VVGRLEGNEQLGDAGQSEQSGDDMVDRGQLFLPHPDMRRRSS
jgi:hypothetical protein